MLDSFSYSTKSWATRSKARKTTPQVVLKKKSHTIQPRKRKEVGNSLIYIAVFPTALYPSSQSVGYIPCIDFIVFAWFLTPVNQTVTNQDGGLSSRDSTLCGLISALHMGTCRCAWDETSTRALSHTSNARKGIFPWKP
ncbi:hypothetical protein MTO96_035447, partial [Rhipicephalus appendiculatus]